MGGPLVLATSSVRIILMETSRAESTTQIKKREGKQGQSRGWGAGGIAGD